MGLTYLMVSKYFSLTDLFTKGPYKLYGKNNNMSGALDCSAGFIIRVIFMENSL